MRGTWKGWEYETSNGLHVYVSKRHYFIDVDRAVCGIRPPKHIGAHKDVGEYACCKCDRIAGKMERGSK